MVHQAKRGGTATLAATAFLFAAGLCAPVQAQSDEPGKRPVPVRHPRGPRATPVRTAEHPLTIRRRVARPVDVGASPSFVYEVPQHSWNDPRLYYFGPFRTGAPPEPPAAMRELAILARAGFAQGLALQVLAMEREDADTLLSAHPPALES